MENLITEKTSSCSTTSGLIPDSNHHPKTASTSTFPAQTEDQEQVQIQSQNVVLLSSRNLPELPAPISVPVSGSGSGSVSYAVAPRKKSSINHYRRSLCKGYGEKKLFKCTFCSRSFVTSKGQLTHEKQWCEVRLQDKRPTTRPRKIVTPTNEENDSQQLQSLRRSTRTPKLRLLKRNNEQDIHYHNNKRKRRKRRIKLRTGSNSTVNGNVQERKQIANYEPLDQFSFECRFCTQIFSRLQDRSVHELQIHLPKVKPYKCRMCDRRFYFAKDCTFHEKLHSQGDDDENSTESNKVNVNGHLEVKKKTLRSDGYFNCNLCTSRYRKKKELKRHMKWRHSEKQNDPKIINEVNKGQEQKPAESERTTTTSNNRNVNSNSNSNLAPAIEATLSSTSIDSGSGSGFGNQHQGNSTESGSGNYFTCSFCNQGFKRKASRDDHERIHKGELPYKCGICEKGFPSRRRFIDHSQRTLCANANAKTNPGNSVIRLTNTNTNNNNATANNFQSQSQGGKNPVGVESTTTPKSVLNQFPCRICDKRLSSSSSVYRHMKIHKRGTKPAYRCQFCPKIFNRKESWRFHQSIHTGDKMFACHICKASFCWSDSVKKHMKRVHGEFSGTGSI